MSILGKYRVVRFIGLAWSWVRFYLWIFYLFSLQTIAQYDPLLFHSTVHIFSGCHNLRFQRVNQSHMDAISCTYQEYSYGKVLNITLYHSWSLLLLSHNEHTILLWLLSIGFIGAKPSMTRQIISSQLFQVISLYNIFFLVAKAVVVLV